MFIPAYILLFTLLFIFIIYIALQVADSLWDISSRLTGCPGSMPCFSGYVPQADVSSNIAAFSEVLNNRLLGQGGEKTLDVNIERL